LASPSSCRRKGRALFGQRVHGFARSSARRRLSRWASRFPVLNPLVVTYYDKFRSDIMTG
jgi:hypothetical protein